MTKTKTVIVTIVSLLALNACTPSAEKEARARAQLQELGREYERQQRENPPTYDELRRRVRDLELRAESN